MNTPRTRPAWAVAAMLVAAGWTIAGCNSGSTEVTSKTSKYEVADDAATPSTPSNSAESSSAAPVASGSRASDFPGGADGQPPLKPPTTPPNGAAPTEPADDSPAAQLAFINALTSQSPRTVPEFQTMLNKVSDAADKVIDAQATDEQKFEAAQAKLAALSQLEELGTPDMGPRRQAFTAQLQKSDAEELKKLGLRLAFANKLQELASGEGGDPQAIIEDFKVFVAAEEKDGQLLQFGDRVAKVLQQLGHTAQAAEVYNLLAAEFATSDDPELKAAAGNLQEVARLTGADFNSLLRNIMEGQTDQVGTLMEKVREVLAADQIGESTFSVMQGIGPTLEVLHPEAARDLYAAMGTAFADHANEEIATQAKQVVENYTKRSSLVGKPFTVEGVTLDGQPFDWKKYQGKVVLVDFWATWCGPCLAEIPNIKENLERYGEHGFEVVGINLDEDPARLQQFLDYQKLPWPSVISANPEARGWEHPMVEECGVVAIPFLVLVGRDGNVVALNTRGDALDKQLAALFPDVPPPAAPPASPPAGGAAPPSAS